MVRGLIEMLLGDVGREMLYFYEANALVINILVLGYGFFMFYSWTNLVRIYRYLVTETAKQIHLHKDLNRKSTNKRIRDTVGVPWEKAIETSPFPFVTRLGGLIPRRKSIESLQYFLDEKEIVTQALAVLKGQANPARIMPSNRRMMRQEVEELQEKYTGQ